MSAQQGVELHLNALQPFMPVVKTLGVADTVVLGDPGSGWWYRVESVTVSNNSAAAKTFDLYLRPVGDVAALANAICQELTINARTVYQLFAGPFVIPAGYVLSGLASAAGTVNVTITGYVQMDAPEVIRR